MQFDPKDVGEYERKALPEGEYDFEVIDAENVVFDDDGNLHDQIRLKCKVFGDDESIITSCWVGYPKLWKLKQFCDAVGLGGEFEKGEISPDECVGKAGRALLGIWKERNTFRKFLPDDQKPKKPKADKKAATKFYKDTEEAQKADDVPF